MRLVQAKSASKEVGESSRTQGPSKNETLTLGGFFVVEQLERYFVGAVGLAVAAVWSLAGSASGLTCLFVAGVCYGATAFSQGGVPGRILETAKQKLIGLLFAARAAWARRAPTQTDQRARRPRPRAAVPARTFDYGDPESTESVVAVEYGW